MSADDVAAKPSQPATMSRATVIARPFFLIPSPPYCRGKSAREKRCLRSRTPVQPDIVTVPVVVRERTGLVEGDALVVLVLQPLEVEADVLREEVLGEGPDALDRER